MAPDDAILQVIDAFDVTGARWALVGAVAFGLRVEPRATGDVDFVVEARFLPAVLARLRSAGLDLHEEDIGAAVRLHGLDVDLIRSSQHALFAEALDRIELVEQWRVPVVEVLVALKHMAAVNPWRARAKRIQDAADLVGLYQTAPAFDRALALRLAGLAYSGASAELADMLDRVDRGGRLEV